MTDLPPIHGVKTIVLEVTSWLEEPLKSIAWLFNFKEITVNDLFVPIETIFFNTL